ncbi:MAG TPA: GGDEF domain-containing protein, partial [Polyangiales bacterium]|nr:GGDEF domain-containing protein [Polyangiales bacterium]
AQSLVRTRDQAAEVKHAVEEVAEDLAAVNVALKDQLTAGPTEAGVGNALYKTERIETRVHDVASELSTVNEALEVEVEERYELNHHVIAVKKEAVMARHAAFHDPLTSLANRAMFDDRLEHGLAQATRHKRTLAVLYIDLDKFKSVNDTFGHAAGDKVLQQVADKLKNMSRSEDTVSRRGGDEFLYLLTELKDEADAAAVATKIIHAVSEPCDVSTDNVMRHTTVTPSIGIAIFPKDGATPEALLARADEAMYRAKRSGLGSSFAR